MSLYKLLNRYKDITKDIVIEVSKEADIESLVKDREEIILSIKEMGFSKEEIKELMIKLEIIEEDNIMFKAIKEERLNIKKELNEIKIRRVARNKYSSNASVPTFLNKKI
ncbi:hypothetical protein H7E67_13605 [Clostridium gasigenes]|uniref:hypothetical protein n=1 Tax=Clostridium gasigenes TaxID=94869 RepID=UPI001624E3C5|nr:hypothetical protein [Clostridium gasigenes]MBB6624473.1 hypothetical protein [Clostridium gasigenes]MBU3088632.1 hypothetical protein [Clostridium gasigenes]